MEGIIGKKLGMTQLFKDNGVVEPVTAIEAGPCVITQIKTKEKDGYNAAQLGYGIAKKLNKPEKKHLGELGSFKYLREFNVDNPSELKQGQVINVALFQVDDVIDVIGTSKGRGFAGGVKRYHFRGGPKTHGQSDRQRAPGSIGSTTSPGRVWKGQRMAGHMGNDRVTAKCLKVLKVLPERNIILVKGAVPGANNGILLIKKKGKS
ncbi:MAG: 50S ribosomal protein L3 [Chloroflexi bacterium]|nr:50S ribosomal protein L3 [Chloroflexota bacterium]